MVYRAGLALVAEEALVAPPAHVSREPAFGLGLYVLREN
jgi:hypothetical protein